MHNINTQTIMNHLQHSNGKLNDYLKCCYIICRHNPVFTISSIVSVIINNSIDCYFVYLSTVHINMTAGGQQMLDGIKGLLTKRVVGACVLLCTEHLTLIMTKHYQPIMCKEIERAISNEEILPVGKFRTMLLQSMRSQIGMFQSRNPLTNDIDIASTALSKRIIVTPKHCAEFLSTLGTFLYCGSIVKQNASLQGNVIICTTLLLASVSVISNIQIFKAEHNHEDRKVTMLRICISTVEFSCVAAQVISFISLFNEINISHAVAVLGAVHSFEPVISSVLRRYKVFNEMMIEIVESYQSYCEFLKHNIRKARNQKPTFTDQE